MNIGIFLRQFKKTNEEIIVALRDGDTETMSELKYSAKHSDPPVIDCSHNKSELVLKSTFNEICQLIASLSVTRPFPS